MLIVAATGPCLLLSHAWAHRGRVMHGALIVLRTAATSSTSRAARWEETEKGNEVDRRGEKAAARQVPTNAVRHVVFCLSGSMSARKKAKARALAREAPKDVAAQPLPGVESKGIELTVRLSH